MYTRNEGEPNSYIVLYIYGNDYNHCFKWNTVEEFQNDLKNNKNIPTKNDIVTEAYINDNLIDMGNTFEILLEKLKLMGYI